MSETPTDRPQKLVIDCSTGQATLQDMTDEEIVEAVESAQKALDEDKTAAEQQRQTDAAAVLNSPLLAGDPVAHAALARLLGITP